MNCDLEHFEVQICSFVTTSDTQIGKNELTFDYRLLTSTETSLYATHEQYDSDGGKGDDVTLFLLWSPDVLLSSKGKVSRGGGGRCQISRLIVPPPPTADIIEVAGCNFASGAALRGVAMDSPKCQCSGQLRLLQSTSGKLMTLILPCHLSRIISRVAVLRLQLRQ